MAKPLLISNQHRAFTLIELLVVISVIGLLSSIILAALSGARAKGAIGAGQLLDDHVYQAFGANAVALWNFDTGNGTTVTDGSGNGNNLTLTSNTMWATKS
jgi:prepilin-type N-terminal cleavage/methylation domain-containing protein